jgi:UDP-N-acetylmuramyl pentapeptide phosphotransferase/UDP-N-acetylglucosamine-1-phosphate transferase
MDWNMDFIIKYIVVFLVGLVAALLLVPFVKRIAPTLGLVDIPSDRRIHKIPIPRCGGIAVFVATHLALAVVFFGPWRNLAGSIQLAEWCMLFVGSLALLLMGLFDDRFGMRAWFKLLGQLGIALLMYFSGFSFGAFLHIQLPFLIDLGATLFWFVLLINAFNLIDGIDGACAGLGLIASAGLAGMLFSLHQPSDALVLVALIGACLGFLRYNFNPASVFLGDCGSMFIGFMLAAVSLKANVKQSMMLALLVPLLAVGVPVFDVILAVWRRMARKLISMIQNDKLACKIFGPDLDHIHHKLMRDGMTQRKAAVSLYAAAVFACLIALGVTAMHSNQTAVLLIGMMVVLHVVVRQLAKVEIWTTTQVVLQGIRRPRSIVGMLVAIGWDIISLMLSTIFVFGLVLSFQATLPLILVCTSIPLATMCFYGIYKTVWTRSRVSQLLVLFLQLLAGEVLAFIALLWIAPELSHTQLLIALALHTLGAAMGVVGGRASLRIARDLGAWLRCLIGSDHDTKTLILGAGENAILYLRQASFEQQQHAPRTIVGLIDNNPALHHKVVFGYPVLGTFEELETVITKHQINEVIFTHHYSEELRASVLALKDKYNLLIREFIFSLRDLNKDGSCQGFLKKGTVHEVDCNSICFKVPDQAVGNIEVQDSNTSESGASEVDRNDSMPVQN